jgi:hypothetical protein
MQIYQPCVDSSNRVIWNGGESTQLHYQFKLQDYACYNVGDEGADGCDWIDVHTRTLGGGLPSSMSELHAEMVDLYNYCSADLHVT